MHVKFIARGTGSAKAAADYLLGERDAAGLLREGVEVRRGDPDRVAAVADSLEFEYKYTSGVIAWAPEDRPTDAQIEAVLDQFEQTAWAGLEPDRYAWSAVEHRERGGGVHVHIFAARCELETGKSLNIAPPGWQQTFGPLRDAFNPSTAGAGPTTRRGRGRTSPATAPTSTRRSCGPASSSRPTRARSSATTCSSASSTASSAAAPTSSRHSRRRDSRCRARAGTM